MKRPKQPPTPPIATDSILLHACCAPCSCAIVETLLNIGIKPTIFYYNPNIFPLEEYERRKSECQRFADELKLTQIDADYNRTAWQNCVKGLEAEPERGLRCLECFKCRMIYTAQYARDNNFKVFATTLASSRWKDLAQIEQAGMLAEKITNVKFWAYNWRKDGLQQRRNDLIKQYNFYNQQYCGCEYSINKD